MGMTAALAAGASPHLQTRASWLFITTNNMREAFYRQVSKTVAKNRSYAPINIATLHLPGRPHAHR